MRRNRTGQYEEPPISEEMLVMLAGDFRSARSIYRTWFVDVMLTG